MKVTEEPVATTVPAPSCEAVQGREVPMMPAETMLSVWQREAVAILTRRSCGPSVRGTGTL